MKKAPAIFFSLCALTMLGGCDDYFTFMIEPTKEIVEVEVECTNDDMRYTTSDGGYCIKQKCNHNKWELESECGNVSCKLENKEYVCGDCFNSTTEYIFEDNICKVRNCTDGIWSSYEDADGSTQCGCKAGDNRIYPSNNNLECLIQECQDNRWVNIDKCGKGKSVSCLIEEEDGDSIKYTCGECQDGVSTCENQGDSGNSGLMKKCQFGKWDYQICEDTSCNGNVCGECKNNTRKCVNDDSGVSSHVSICKNGKWEFESNCNLTSCNAAKDACGECLDNEITCISIPTSSDNGLIDYGETRQCIYGKWEKFYECRAFDEKRVSCRSKNCNDTSDCILCGVCQNGDQRIREVENVCSKYMCHNGDWIREETSSDEVSCYFTPDGDIAMGKCLNGTRRCNENTLQVCANGQYSDFMSCKGCSIANDNTVNCKTDCDSSNIQICNDNIYHVGVYFKCENGISTVNPCQNENMCDAQKENCGQCRFEERNCKNNDIGVGFEQICDHGDFIDLPEKTCDFNNSCSGAVCGECHNGDIKCTDNGSNALYSTCLDGQWSKATPCTNIPVSCTDNVCGICRDGSIKFENMPDFSCARFICKNGQWTQDNYICPDNHSCTTDNDMKKCGTCKNNTFTNDGWRLYTCIDGSYQSNEWCDWGGTITKGEYKVCKYNKNTNSDDNIDCYNDYIDRKHIGYHRDDDTPCNTNSPVSCHVIGVNQTTCGDCLELETRCDGTTPQTCINGKWTTDLPEWHTADRCANNE